MTLLLDTHVWLWLLDNPALLPDTLRAQLATADELLLSAASVWELAIKAQLGNLKLEGGLTALVDEAVRALAARALPITAEHAILAASLPPLHRDSFDRKPVAQAQVLGVPLVTADEQVRAYGGTVLWARS